jgi:hypothetical protein
MAKREPDSTKKAGASKAATTSGSQARRPQNASGGASGGTSSGGGSSDSAQRAMAERGAAATGEEDTNYNLVSVLYHALKAADSITEYIQDATADGDDELAQFMESARVAQVEIADRAKSLLAERFGAEDEDEDEDEDDDEDE